MAALNQASLPALAGRGADVPRYARTGAPGVVHLGLGAFHRAHQALVFDTLLQRGDNRWGVLGVAMRNPVLADTLRAQDGLYSVQLGSSAGTQWRIGGALWHTCVAAVQAQQVVQAMAAPSTRWITLTVTEKAYGEPLAQLLVQGLAARQAAGHGGLTVACCDNLTDNGRHLLALCLDTARRQGAGLAGWIADTCAFPNSMVDRIVPAGSEATAAAAAQALGVEDRAALQTEAYWEWVIERRFVDAGDADALASSGVLVVDDVAPFEEAKLRMLNASHSAMACIGAVAGLPLVNDCVAQPVLRAFVHGLMGLEVGPQLARHDWPAYRDALLLRFANPTLAHRVHQIATDSSLKIPQRWVPAIHGALHRDLPVQRLAFAAAAWMRYCLGRDDGGTEFALSDPQAARLQQLARRHAGDAAATVAALGGLAEVWGDALVHHDAWNARVTQHLQQIQSHGMLASLSRLA